MKNEIPAWMSRTRLLLGDEPVHRLMQAHVLVVGLGGVGGICAEMIARAGVGKLSIVDADTVEASNRNRQVPALFSTENQLKSSVMAARIRDVNPDIELQEFPLYMREESTDEILRAGNYDYVVDCIDTLSPKVFLLKKCFELGLPVVSSMGAGGKTDPTQLKISSIWKSYNCNLAYYVRKRLSNMGLRNRPLTAVWSPEKADQSRIIPAPEGNPKKSLIGTISYMPAVFGCAMASVAIREIMNKKS